MTKKRDKEYGPKPQDVPLKREEIPQSPAKIQSGYCKKAKAKHEFELDDVMIYTFTSHPQGYSGPEYITELWRLKYYRCVVCGKKKLISEKEKLDEPVLRKKEANA